MGKQGCMVYKCRACGMLFDGVHSPNSTISGINLMLGIPSPKEWGPQAPNLLEMHTSCKVLNTGIGDFCGWTQDKDG